MSNELPIDVWDAIVHAACTEGLGIEGRVVCDDCNGEIEDGSMVKGYLGGRGTRWSLSRVYHEDCNDLIVPNRIGVHENDQEAIVFGTLAYAPDIADREQEKRDMAKREFEAIFGDDTVYQSPPPEHHLTDIELAAAHIPGEGRFERHPEMADPRVHVTKSTDVTDHLHLEVESMTDSEFEAFVSDLLSVADDHAEVVNDGE